MNLILNEKRKQMFAALFESTSQGESFTWRLTIKQTHNQWATKAVETHLENDAFYYWSTCSILFASSVNFLISRPPNSMLCRLCECLCGLCCLRNRKINIVFGGGECSQSARKSNFTAKCLNSFVSTNIQNFGLANQYLHTEPALGFS